MSIILEDEYGGIYGPISGEYKNLLFPIKGIQIYPRTKVVFSNTPDFRLTDSIENNSDVTLTLRHADIMDRIKISDIHSLRVEPSERIEYADYSDYYEDSSLPLYSWLLIAFVILMFGFIIYLLYTECEIVVIKEPA